ncbi:Bug family tripartite tricarboxylate transporter substrate binding protein [Variovorax sp. N23]|uniref:Bug family tripartite tricarboxylate transporter substrate binding protein n=1 Tax=Variovorax sp. N23 TaxID=2980555 RepID=UPI0021C9B8A5|nr:tripartite tricarboxylate transporter substrate binding protein [Variovorax sp. N23]MCU4119106.1 tripartite tricarboxylate transporter substrate binding protein [Variovorax sp. N23]
MTYPFRRTLVAASLTLAVLGASAADYPSRPITIEIPYPPGGTADSVARPLSVELGKRLGVPVILDYKAGAGGAIATQFVAKANPDGYTLVMVLAAHAINPSLYKNLPYDSVKDFTPISMVAKLPLVLYSNPKFGPKTVPELIEYAKKNSGRLSFGSAGSGNTSHLAGELFASTAGVQMLHVPYKGGGPSITAAVGGEIPTVFAGPDSLGMARSGRLHVVAVTSPERSPLIPDVPAIAETLKGFEVYGWYGLLAPANTPAAVVQKLNTEINATLKSPEFKKMVEPLGYIPTGSTPVEFSSFVETETKRWGEVIRKADIKLE